MPRSRPGAPLPVLGRLRTERGLTRSGLARLAGVAVSTVAQIELGW